MELDKSIIAVSSEYFIKVVFSVPVQSFVYNVKRTGDKTYPCRNGSLFRLCTFEQNEVFSMVQEVYNPDE